MHQWFLSYNGQQVGPLDQAAAQRHARQNPNGHCWRQGFAEWIPISACAELAEGTALVVPAPPASGRRSADEIDYRIHGEDMQFVEIELDPGESAIAEAGALMYKDSVVQMETLFGDGSHSGQGGGFLDKLVGAGKRLITGESLFTTVFSHAGGSGAGIAPGADSARSSAQAAIGIHSAKPWRQQWPLGFFAACAIAAAWSSGPICWPL